MSSKIKNEKKNSIAQNKRAYFDYQVIDTWEAGIKLIGQEVRGLRSGNVSITEAWVRVANKHVFLINSSIVPPNLPQWEKYDPHRERILLLHKNEIKKLQLAVQKGFTLIPLKLYFNDKGIAKILIATAKGKKLYDKRQTIRDRDLKRKGLE